MQTLAMDYANEAMVKLLAGIFDYAVNYCRADGDEFWNSFIVSQIAVQFEKRNSKYILGKDAAEIVSEVFDRLQISQQMPEEYISFDRTPEYWGGWALSQYQIHSGLSYKKIHDLITFKELIMIYHPLHEAPVKKAFDLLDARRSEMPPGLKEQRELMGLSQSALARQSGTSLRTLQAYEQGLKNIRHASPETLRSLSSVLACREADLF